MGSWPQDIMKLRFLGLAFALTIAICVCACQRKRAESQVIAAPLPDVTFCEVVGKPDEFDGKLIRLHALLVRESMHGGAIGDAQCATKNNITYPKLSANALAEIKRAAPAAAYDVVA